MAGLRHQRRSDGQDPNGQPVIDDAIFTDPEKGLILFLEGLRGHHVNYLEITSEPPQPAPAH